MDFRQKSKSAKVFIKWNIVTTGLYLKRSMVW